MTSAVIALAGAAAVCVWPSAPRPAGRLAALRQPAAVARATGQVRRPLVLAALAGGPLMLLLRPPWWLVVLAAVALGAGLLGRRRPPPSPEVPLVIDLIASCLSAGTLMATAVAAAASAASLSRRRELEEIAGRLHAGEPPEVAWAGWLADPRLAPVARACVRSAASGAAVAAELSRAAARMRSASATEAQRRLAAASVWVVLPLGLCFLPAFVLVGVVPVVVGLFGRMG